MKYTFVEKRVREPAEREHRQFQKHHLEGHDEDDARDGGDADEPAPPNGGDDHGGHADDEQGASKPEHLGRKTGNMTIPSVLPL